MTEKPPLSDVELAYAAGVFDGEGSVGTKRDSNHSEYPRIRANVGNTDPRLIAWFKDRFGGYVYLNVRKPPNKPCYQWEVNSRMAAAFLGSILPYLVIKRERAEIALQIAALKKWGGGRTRSSPSLVEQLEMARAIKTMNMRGKK